MEKLAALNIALRAIGQSAAASLDTEDPDVAEWENHYQTAKREVLQNGYPFNTDKVTLSLDGNSRIPASTYLSIPILSSLGLTIRNGFVWNPRVADYYSTALGSNDVVVDVEWSDIPQEFQDWIAHRAAVSYLLQVKGPTTDLIVWQRMEASKAAKAELLYPVNLGVGTGWNRTLSNFNR